MENGRKKLGQKLTRKVMEMQKLNVEIGNLEDLSIKERARILIKFRISSMPIHLKILKRKLLR